MALGFGDNSWVGFGAESTFGTPVARSKYFEFKSEGLKWDTGKEPRPSLRGRSRNRRGKKKNSTAGPIELQMQVNGMEILLHHMLGSVNTTGPVSSQYTHTFTLARNLPTGLSVEMNRDASAIGGSAAFLYDGCQIQKWTLKHEPGDFLNLSIDLIGEGDSSNVAVSTPTFATFVGWDWDSFACTINGVSTTIRSFELTGDNNLSTDRYALGANKRKGFGGAGPRSISGKITLEFDSLTASNYFRNQVSLGMQFIWTNGLDSMTLSLANDEFTAGEPIVGDAKEILITLEFETYLSSAEGDELNIILVNTTAGPVP